MPTPGANLAHPDRVQIARLLRAQVLFALLSLVIAWPFGPDVAVSATIGAGGCLLANGFFAVWVFRRYRAGRPDRLLLRIYGAEIAKISIILTLFSLAFVMIDDLNLPALLVAYFVVQVLPALFASRPDARPTAEK